MFEFSFNHSAKTKANQLGLKFNQYFNKFKILIKLDCISKVFSTFLHNDPMLSNV